MKKESLFSLDRSIDRYATMTLINMCLIERNQFEGEINKNNKCICSFIYQRQFDIFIEWIHHFHYQRNEKENTRLFLLSCIAIRQQNAMSLIINILFTSKHMRRICQECLEHRHLPIVISIITRKKSFS